MNKKKTNDDNYELRKDGLRLKFKVNVYMGNELVKPSELRKLTINNINVNRIVNEVVDRITDKNGALKAS